MAGRSKKSADLNSWAVLAKKIVYASLGSAAMAKDFVADSKWQKDLLSGILVKAEKRKEELLEILAREVSSFLGKINVSSEISKALKGLVINLNASIDFKEKKGTLSQGKAGNPGGFNPRVTFKRAGVIKTNLEELEESPKESVTEPPPL